MNEIKKYAVVVAGGKGVRMGASVPKQFLPFMGKPLLCCALQAFSSAMPGIKLILVAPPDLLSSAQTVLRSYLSDLEVTVVVGGETRFHSVQNGLKEIKGPGVVFVHDGVRPLISADLIQRCYKAALEKGSAIPAIPVNESMRILTAEGSSPIDRDKLRIIQTPQTFMTDIIMPAFRQPYDPAFTDEATVVEAYGTKVNLVMGMADNIKVTTPEDLIRAEALYVARV
jgi:2-C-methyl-D-erythritol 4-phosphate cytidylyltransferase